MKKQKSIGVSSATLKKIIDIKNKATNSFVTVTEQNVIDAVFSKPVSEIVTFINSNRSTVKSTNVPKEKSVRRKKVKQLPREWRDTKVAELLASKKTIVKTRKEATSLYNHFKHAGTGTITYSTKKRGGIEVLLHAK